MFWSFILQIYRCDLIIKSFPTLFTHVRSVWSFFWGQTSCSATSMMLQNFVVGLPQLLGYSKKMAKTLSPLLILLSPSIMRPMLSCGTHLKMYVLLEYFHHNSPYHRFFHFTLKRKSLNHLTSSHQMKRLKTQMVKSSTPPRSQVLFLNFNQMRSFLFYIT